MTIDIIFNMCDGDAESSGALAPMQAGYQY